MKLLIFDIDGTLTDTIGVDNESYITAFQDEFAVDLAIPDWSIFKHVTDAGLFQELFTNIFGKPPEASEMESFRGRFFSYLESNLNKSPERFNEISGAKNFVTYCRQQDDIRIAFATGGWSKSARVKLQAAEIPFLNLPLSSSDLFISRREILQDAVAQSLQKYKPDNFEKFIYFGDGAWDLKTTTEMKIPFVGVDAKKDDKLKALGATKIINGFADVAQVLKILAELEIYQ